MKTTAGLGAGRSTASLSSAGGKGAVIIDSLGGVAAAWVVVLMLDREPELRRREVRLLLELRLLISSCSSSSEPESESDREWTVGKVVGGSTTMRCSTKLLKLMCRRGR